MRITTKLIDISEEINDLAKDVADLAHVLNQIHGELESRDNKDPEIRQDYDPLNYEMLINDLRKRVATIESDIENAANQIEVTVSPLVYEYQPERSETFKALGKILNPNPQVNDVFETFIKSLNPNSHE